MSGRRPPHRRGSAARALAALAGMVALAPAASCGPPCDTDADCPEGTGCKEGFCASECARDEDCPLGTDCGPNHLCGPPAAGSIVWKSPAEGASVDERFDAELEVSFRAASAILHIGRGDDDPGDECAPFVPFKRVLEGDAEQYLRYTVSVPGLRALGERFSLLATLQSSAGGAVGRVALHGPASGTGGARFTQPDEERSYDAADTLTVPVGAELDRAAALVSVHVEPVDGTPGPIHAVGSGLTAFRDFPVLLARGPQVIWVEADLARCGRGVEGTGEDTHGLELGLYWHGDEATELGLRLLVDGEAGSGACDFREPGLLCEAVRETPAPAPSGEQLLRVPLADGTAQIAVVPGAAGGYVMAEVRVSMDGRHLGWLGPFPLDTSVGQAWIAGQVVVGQGGAQLLRTDEVSVGAPW